MARERPTASDVQHAQPPHGVRKRASQDDLTRAEVRALSRSAPLTKAEFKAQRLKAEQRIEPLRVVLALPADGVPGAPSQSIAADGDAGPSRIDGPEAAAAKAS